MKRNIADARLKSWPHIDQIACYAGVLWVLVFKLLAYWYRLSQGQLS